MSPSRTNSHDHDHYHHQPRRLPLQLQSPNECHQHHPMTTNHLHHHPTRTLANTITGTVLNDNERCQWPLVHWQPTPLAPNDYDHDHYMAPQTAPARARAYGHKHPRHGRHMYLLAHIVTLRMKPAKSCMGERKTPQSSSLRARDRRGASGLPDLRPQAQFPKHRSLLHDNSCISCRIRKRR